MIGLQHIKVMSKKAGVDRDWHDYYRFRPSSKRITGGTFGRSVREDGYHYTKGWPQRRRKRAVIG